MTTRSLAIVPGMDLNAMSDQDLVHRAQRGDGDALAIVLDRYRKLARYLARSYDLPGSEEEDLVQEAMIGLFKAIRDFDLGRGAPFRPFLTLCVKRQMHTAIKNANRLKHRLLNTAVSLEDLDPSSPMDPGPIAAMAAPGVDVGDLVASADAVDRLRDELCDMLTALEREVLRMYMADRSYVEMASVFGSSLKSIDNALQRVKYKFQRHFTPTEDSV
jgi:RNA polymerase sporulation-specific sigma factor